VNNFQKSSQYYDLIYRKKSYLKESEFIKKFIKKDLKRKNILEIGCGTGGHANILSKSNFNLFCLDPSKEMIKIAKLKYKKQNVKFFCTKLETFNNRKKFDVCLSLFHVINYFNSTNKLKKFFKLTHKFLKKDGLLIFDFWNGYGVENSPPKKTLKVIKNNKFKLTRFAIPKFIKNKKQVIINYNYQIIKKNKKINFSEKHKLRYVFPKDIEMFSKKKFKIIKVGKWMTFKKPKKNDWFAYAVLKAI